VPLPVCGVRVLSQHVETTHTATLGIRAGPWWDRCRWGASSADFNVATFHYCRIATRYGLIHRLVPPAGAAPDRMSQIGGRPLMGLISRLREGVYSLEKTVAPLRQLISEALITNLGCRVILRMWSCVR
jgi:hypothetical protein